MTDEITILDNKKLIEGGNKVIDCLSQYEPAYKIAILEHLIKSFPKDYILETKKI